MPPRVILRTSTYFDEQLEALKKRKGDFQQLVLHEAEDMLDNLKDLANVTHPKAVLGSVQQGGASRVYDLTGVFRQKRGFNPKLDHHGLRLFYIWSAGDDETFRVVALQLGERRPGQPDDAYLDFGDRLQRGYFDRYFVALGLKHAFWQIPDAPVQLSSSSRT